MGRLNFAALFRYVGVLAWQLNSITAMPMRLSISASTNKGGILDYVGNDYRHFVSLVACGFGSRSNVRRHFTCSTSSCGRSIRDSTSDGTSSGLTLREHESFC